MDAIMKFNSSWPSGAHMRLYTTIGKDNGLSLVRRPGIIWPNGELDHREQTSMKFKIEYEDFVLRKYIWK